MLSCRHKSLSTCNEELAAYNKYSAEQHARLAGHFARHVGTLQSVQARLLTVFRRVRALRSRLLEAHPELAAAAREHDAAREAEIERARESPSSIESVAAGGAQSSADTPSAAATDIADAEQPGTTPPAMVATSLHGASAEVQIEPELSLDALEVSAPDRVHESTSAEAPHGSLPGTPVADKRKHELLHHEEDAPSPQAESWMHGPSDHSRSSADTTTAGTHASEA